MSLTAEALGLCCKVFGLFGWKAASCTMMATRYSKASMSEMREGSALRVAYGIAP
jgi:hypothetical protein